MNTYKRILALLLLVAAIALLAGCSQKPTPYQTNNDENYTVSVRYDANGGYFGTNTAVITDSYSLEELASDSQGKAKIALLAPNDKQRGNDAFTPVNNGYFLAGWYAQRNEATDDSGNTVYTYAEPWDFDSDRLSVDADGSYSADEPVLTLYAAWVPEFCVDFYCLDSGQLLDTYAFDPILQGTTLQLPAWDEETGAMEMHEFPARDGYTFAGAYYDADRTQPITEAVLTHNGTVDLNTATASGGKMTVYVDWDEGEWYRIHTVEQFRKNASLSGCYILEADLDFTDEIWPTTFLYGSFTGSIRGNGHTIRNVSLTQTDNAKLNAGLFGHLAEGASLTDVTFENVTFTIKSGARMAGTSYGILAGSVSSETSLSGVKLQNSTLAVDSGAFFLTEDYTVGLLCGIGLPEGVEAVNLQCVATGKTPENVIITVNGNAVTLEFKS